MKKLLIDSLAVFSLLVIGCSYGRLTATSPDADVVHAQASGETFTNCQTSSGGGGDSTCSQYLVQVNTRRGVPKFQFWQVQSNPVQVDGSNNASQFVNYGVGSSVSMQAFELATGTQTFTLTAGEP